MTAARRREGIGTRLLDAVTVGLVGAGDAGTRASVDRTNEAGMAFLKGQGFRLLMATRAASIDLSCIPADWQRRSEQARQLLDPFGVRIESLASRPDLFYQTARAHERIYRDQHGWDPPAQLTNSQAMELFLDPGELDPEL